MSYEETAEAVGVSAATVDRDLRLAKAWLKVELGQADRGRDMTPERWARVEALFEEALARPSADAGGWVGARAGDPDLAALVASMLARR